MKTLLRLFVVVSMLSGLWSSVVAAPLPQEEIPPVYLPLVSTLPTAEWIGPDGGSVVVMAIDPFDPDIVYAGSWGAGVFKSLDGGQTWQAARKGLGNLYINSIAIDPLNPAVLYAGTYTMGVYKTTDGGENWVHSSVGIQDSTVVYAIAIDPSDTNRIYIGTRRETGVFGPPWYGVMYRSTDGGATWQVAKNDVGGGAEQDWVYSIAIQAGQTNVILAAAHESGIYRSTDFGVTWSFAGDDLCRTENGAEVCDYAGRSILFDPRASEPDQNRAYYGPWTRDGRSRGVWRSYDEGLNWSVSLSGATNEKIYSMTLAPSNPATLFLANFGNGVYKSVDSALSWTQSGLAGERAYVVAVDPQNSSKVYSGTVGTGPFVSTDGGASWTRSAAGLENATVNALFVSPLDSAQMFAAVFNNGVQRSLDGGQTWQDFSAGLGDRAIYALMSLPGSPNILFAVTDHNGLYRLDLNVGLPWIKTGTGLPTSESRTQVFDAGSPFASRETLVDDLTPDEAIGRLDASIQTEMPLLDIAIAPSRPNVMFVGSNDKGVYRSANGGVYWGQAGLYGMSVSDLAVDPTNHDLVYAVTNQFGRVWWTTNGGGSWSPLSLPAVQPYAVSISPLDPAVVFVGTSSGVFKRAGAGWVSAGLDGKAVTEIAFSPVDTGLVFAGTTDGVYISTNGGETWVEGPAELRGITIQSISFDPNDPGLVYYGTKTHGTLRARN